MRSNVDPNDSKATRTMVILPCPTCGRSVKVLGRVRRVLCACGQILLEIGQERANPSIVRKVG